MPSTYLPIIGGNDQQNTGVEPGPDIQGNPCGMPAMAYELFERIRTAPEQQRPHMHCNTTLTEVAILRIRDMFRRNYFSHTTPGGITINEQIREAGYRLPGWYPAKGNSCESIGGNTITVEDQYQGWYESPQHYAHMFGTDPFYAEQTEIGMWYIYEDHIADVDAIWCFLSAPPMPPILIYDLPVAAG